MSRTWRKSSYSGTGNEDCVEVSFDSDVAVRDSKNPAPELTFPTSTWHEFLHRVSGDRT